MRNFLQEKPPNLTLFVNYRQDIIVRYLSACA